MYSITVDVVRQVLEVSVLGMPTDSQIEDLMDQLGSAMATLHPSRCRSYRVRIKARPMNPGSAQLVARIRGVLFSSGQSRLSSKAS